MLIECIKCFELKDEEEFHRDKGKLKGRVSRCKVCKAAHHKEWRAIPGVKESIAEYQKEYQQTDAGRASLKKKDDKIRATPEGQQKYKARTAVYNAVKAGRMIKPERCQWAGPVGLDLHICEETQVEAHHHHGYEPDSWLDVQWVCKEHHVAADKLKDAWDAWKVGLSRELTLIAQS